MATLTGKKINTTYDGLLKTEDNQPISTTKKKVTDGYGNETGLSVDSLGNVDVSDDLNVLGNAVVTGSTTANSFIKTGGTSAQFLKANGSIDSNTYITSESDTLDSVTDRGNSTTNSITVNGLTATTATVESIQINGVLRDGIGADGVDGQILTSTGTSTDWKSKIELGLIDGSGTTNRLPKFTDADTIGNSTITDDGTKIGVNNANPTYSLDVYRNEATNILRLQNNTFSSWFGSDASGFSIETNLFKPIVFKPSGVTAMTLDSSGNVGIGTSSPSSFASQSNQLVVGSGSTNQGMTIYSSSTSEGNIFFADGTTGDQLYRGVLRYDHDGDFMSVFTAASERMRITSAGNVGIGTSSPTQRLQVNNGTDLNVAFNTTVVDSITTSRISSINDAVTAGVGLVIQGTPLVFESNGAERMRIASNGNVGIRTNSPVAPLDVYSDGSAVGINIRSRSGSDFGNIKFSDDTGAINLWAIGNIGSDFRIVQGGSTERMRIDSSGNVGIGTSSPNVKLHILEQTNAAQFWLVSTGDNVENRIASLENTGSDYANLLIDSDEVIFRTTSTTSLAERMRIDSSGNVGIGTSSPDSILHINQSNPTVKIFSGGSSGSSSVLSLGKAYNGTSTIEFHNTSSGEPLVAQIQCDTGENIVFETNPEGTLGSNPSFVFQQAGSEAMRIDSSGNVGIGTISPNGKAHIRNSALTGFQARTGATLTLENSTETELYIASGTLGQLRFGSTTTSFDGALSYDVVNNNMIFYTGSAERMNIKSGGDVSFRDTSANQAFYWDASTARLGIGTTSPTVQLESRNAAGSTIKASNTAGGYVEMKISSNTDSLASINFTNTLSINGGYVGIGASSPATNLHILSAASTPAVRIQSTHPGGIPFLDLKGAAASQIRYIDETGTIQTRIDMTDNGGFSFVDVAGSASPRMVINSSGNVGIGTSSPSAKLQIIGSNYSVANSGRAIGGIDLRATSNLGNNGYGAGISFSGVGTGRSAISAVQNSSDTDNMGLAFFTHGSSSGDDSIERMRITSDGDVLIGTTGTPNGTSVFGAAFIDSSSARNILYSAASTTSGAALCQFYNPNGFVGQIQVNGSSTNYVTSSDYRLKEDWQPMANALDRVEALKPINFAWKVDGTRVDGFLAHEVQAIIPEAVAGEKDATEEYEIPAVLDEEGNVIEEATTGVRDVYQGIDQSKIVPLLTAALQEANQMIKELTTRIETLENK